MRALAVPLLLLACGDDATSSLADAGAQASVDAAQVGDSLPSTCTSDCAAMDLAVDFGATTDRFDRAFFGLTAPAIADSGEWEVYIENSAGDDDQCPTEGSPTPRFLLSLGGFKAPTEVSSASASATLVDFEGTLLSDEVFERANANQVNWIAADLCIACAEGGENDRAGRMVAFDLDATFVQGTVSGHVYATHCGSLDKL